MKILKALLAASLLAPIPALAGAPPIPPAPTIIVGAGTPVTGTCPSTQFLFNNAGLIGCSAGSGASMAIGGAVTGGTTGNGLYVNGASLGQFAYGANVFTALGSALNGSGAISATTSPAFVTPNLGTPSAAVLTNATGLPLTTGVTGNLPVTNLGSGTGASSTTYWRGDGTWATPSAGGGITVGTTAVSGICTTGYNLYNNGGVVGCQANGGGGTLTANSTLTSGFTAGQLLMSNGTTLAVAGAANATSLALGGATLGSNALAVTGNIVASGYINGVSLSTNAIYGAPIGWPGGPNWGGIPSVNLGSTAFIAWGNSAGTAQELFLQKDAADILAQRDGANAQSFRVANTWSGSGTNYEYGIFDWQTTANVLTIGTTNGGTGLARNLQFVVGGANKLDYGITNAANWTFGASIYFPNLVATGSTFNLTVGAGTFTFSRDSVLTGALGISTGIMATNGGAFYLGAGTTSPDIGLSRLSANVLGLGNGTASDVSGTLKLAMVQSAGTVPTGTTGSCVASSFTGGATAGKFSAAVCVAGTIILSAMPTTTNGYSCVAVDQTTPADTVTQTASTTTSVTFKATTVAADAIAYHCIGY